VEAHQVPRRVDEHEGRPCTRREPPPEDELGVVDHRVFESVAANGFADAVVVVLGGVLAGVHADDREGVAELVLEALEIRDDVLAVDAAERPEVEEDDLAAKLLEL
jgi:hypothetical protein